MGIPKCDYDLSCLTYSTKSRTPLRMNKLSREARAQILGLMVEGMSMRAISRITGG